MFAEFILLSWRERVLSFDVLSRSVSHFQFVIQHINTSLHLYPLSLAQHTRHGVFSIASTFVESGAVVAYCLCQVFTQPRSYTFSKYLLTGSHHCACALLLNCTARLSLQNIRTRLNITQRGRYNNILYLHHPMVLVVLVVYPLESSLCLGKSFYVVCIYLCVRISLNSNK